MFGCVEPNQPAAAHYRNNHSALEGEAVFGQGDVDSGVPVPGLCLPLNVSSHEMRIHPGHGDAHTLSLKLTPMIP